ncbi:hypothetical protein KSF_027310 [Reticulibacter mediterranei]|uniref:HTH marR-type domain-containing protein n=1 Tax=Reticulibacter mediterranei TaxID=2778369 RepID=A0A8J3IHQ1_9CHLR|nr:MarR family transcriptional regulator [Reticulibacter mediterranei]GHO92683.1 hypothetical protein KSF_027310 [Reticulibacter mediterranei]
MIEQDMGYQLKRAQYALRTRMDSTLREIGLTTPQYSALSALHEHAGLSGASLARRCFVTPQTMNTIVTNLEEAGLLVRRPHPEHGRVLQAYLTPQAETLLQEGHRRVRAIEERMMASISHDQWLQLTVALQACADALEKDGTETGALP